MAHMACQLLHYLYGYLWRMPMELVTALVSREETGYLGQWESEGNALYTLKFCPVFIYYVLKINGTQK